MAQTALTAHFQKLKQHRSRLELSTLAQLFQTDNQRAHRFSLEDDGLLFDFSKNRIDNDSLDQLVELAHDGGVGQARTAMFSGEKINFTESRAVLHTALRAGKNSDGKRAQIVVDGIAIAQQISEEKQRVIEFSNKVREGLYRLGGKAVSDIVNIGIGGSDLGPVMCVGALAPYCSGPKIHFVSNVDSADFHDTTQGLDPATTLFIIASKSFTTTETMANAALAKNWLSSIISPDDIGKHFVALSTNLSATAQFGIDQQRTFGFWDWVGGRYSIWSAIGLSLMIAIGEKHYQDFLDGARSADQHFLDRDFKENIPVIMALLGIWHRNIWDYRAIAILPYDNRLMRFPAYLQQLDMESNGKHICRDGGPSTVSTGPLVWGEPGTNGQHAFYQLLHQGTDIIPCDFLVAAKSHEKDQSHQKMLVANCLAQSEALMIGRSAEEVAKTGISAELVAHKVFEGNRPSSTFLYRQLDPYILGKLIAFYEHKVFVQGVIWGINSFDQWGVELGKQLAAEIEPLLDKSDAGKGMNDHDGSTVNLIDRYRKLSK